MPSAKKTRPPRIYLDKKSNRYYIIQNKVKRFFDENDLTKIVEAVKTGKLAYKTSKKSKTWLETFKPQTAPVNNDTGFLPGELTPIERRKIEKAKWEVYGNAVERYKQEQEEYSKKLRAVKELEDQKLALKQAKEEIKINELAMDDKKESLEIFETLLKNNKETLEVEINLAKLNDYKEFDQELRELMKEYNELDRAIMNETRKTIKDIGIDKFYQHGYASWFETNVIPLGISGDLIELFKRHSEVNKQIAILLFKITNTKQPPKVEESKYEKEIKAFLENLTVADLKKYVKFISDSQPVLLWKDQFVTFILADPKVSKIAQLAYIKLAEKGKVKFDDFYNKSLEIKKSAVGFGSEDDYDGLYGDEIIKIMKPYKGFLGVIMNDEIPTLIEDSLHYDRFGFVINTDNSDQDGSHWCAVFVDIPDGSIEYFDSFGEEPSEEIKRDMAELLKEHDINYLMKFKVNGQKVQDLRTGSCGWFAMKFLIDRFNGVPFATASGFKVTSIGSKRGESKVKNMKKSFGYI